VLLREGTEFLNIEANSEVTYAVAFGYRFGGVSGPVKIGAELNGAVALPGLEGGSDIGIEEAPLEGTIYAKINPTEEWEISVGPSMGFVAGYGVPTFRFHVGVRYRPTSHDRDHDGIPDEDDDCPGIAEDRDGDEDLDGCPEEDPDDDSDGVPNDEDDCPEQKETINGVDDDDGCPDGGPAKVIYEGGEIRITEAVHFRTGSAEIDPVSHSILDQVALTMKANKQIERVRVEGHTDDTGPRDLNMKLSQQRAESVRRYLISRGVSPDRLTAKGYGPDDPVIDEKTEAARAKNRRVEFIVEQ
jgi:outer membrane protein OmpA-like peptidoglycan-associated protein